MRWLMLKPVTCGACARMTFQQLSIKKQRGRMQRIVTRAGPKQWLAAVPRAASAGNRLRASGGGSGGAGSRDENDKGNNYLGMCIVVKVHMLRV